MSFASVLVLASSHESEVAIEVTGLGKWIIAGLVLLACLLVGALESIKNELTSTVWKAESS